MSFALPKEIKDKFSSRALSAISLSVTISEKYKHEFVSTLHLLYGVFHTSGSIGSNLLKSYGFTDKNLDLELKTLPAKKQGNWLPKFDELLKDALKKAILASEKASNNYVGTEHLLFALVSQKGDERMVKFFEKLEFPLVIMQEHLLAMTTQAPKFQDVSKLFQSLTHDFPGIEGQSDEQSSTPELDEYSQDLTLLAEQNKLDPVIGRESEIERMINVLNRRLKNNPVLVGDAGVGKTAIIEGLAQKIVEGKVPEALVNKRVVSLNLSSVLASTTFRGDFEARLKRIMEEIEQDPNTIIFIDEIHTIVGAGTSSGQPMDAANILKPALTKNYFKVIGATTPREYFQFIEKDSALKRRFQRITVKEPTKEETLEILKGVTPTYENFYNIKIMDDALETTIDISKRYLSEGNFPDKAIDIIDEACSKATAKKKKSAVFTQLNDLELELNKLDIEKEKMVADEQYEKAKEIKTKLDSLKKKLDTLKKKYEKEKTKNKIKITSEHVLSTIAEMTNIPVEKMQQSDSKKFERLEKNSKRKIVGQDVVLDKIFSSLKRYKSGLADPNRPISSFMFLGPSGVGKTETAKVIAKDYFGSEDNLIRIDMTEFSEKHQTSRLVGAPAGYVGYEEGGELTEKIKKNPYSVVLFDEIEKANRESINILMQILEDGVLTSAQGEKVYFNNALIIMTSNIGTMEFVEEAIAGFSTNQDDKNKGPKHNVEKKYQEIKKNAVTELKEMLRPEFINRIDEVVVFKPLGPAEIKTIIRNQFKLKQQQFKDKMGLDVKLDKSALSYLADKGFIPEYGARPIRRLIQTQIESLIAEGIIDGKITASTKKVYLIKADDKKVWVE